MPTIYEVAARAGVSPATVSRVMNGVNVSQEKSALVLEAISALKFTPNRTARSLRRQNSEVIALIIPDIENPFFTSLARGAEDVAQSAGFSVVLCNTDDDLSKETRYLDIAVSDNMAGVILAAAGPKSDVGSLIRRGRPVVAVDRVLRGFAIDTVTVDNIGGARAATQSLADQGYSRIACITGPKDVKTAKDRADGWRQAIGSRFSDSTDRYLRYSNYHLEGGRAAMQDLSSMEAPPDAVFIANNLMAVGALQVLVERGQTPPQVGVAMFGELPFAALAPTGITIVNLPARELGVTAATLLLERIDGDTQLPRTVVLSHDVSGAVSGDVSLG